MQNDPKYESSEYYSTDQQPELDPDDFQTEEENRALYETDSDYSTFSNSELVEIIEDHKDEIAELRTDVARARLAGKNRLWFMAILSMALIIWAYLFGATRP